MNMKSKLFPCFLPIFPFYEIKGQFYNNFRVVSHTKWGMRRQIKDTEKNKYIETKTVTKHTNQCFLVSCY